MTDLRYALRMLRKNPLFTGIAVLVLALAIGGNTAMFSVVNALALRPITARNPKELVGCYSRENKPDGNYRGFSYPNYTDLRERNTVFENLMAYSVTMIGVAEGETTRRVFAAMVSANYFATFGVQLARGRAFTADEERPGSAVPVAIVSHSYWKRTGADPALVGNTVRLNNRVFTIVGIAPEYFSGTAALFSPEFWVPLGMYEHLAADYMNKERRLLSERGNHCLMLAGRLKPGLSMAAAQAQLQPLARQLEAAHPDVNKDRLVELAQLPRLSISTAPKEKQHHTMTVILLSMSGVVLLIACLNLANMLLARGAARRKEIAIRTALGGARFRIMRQLLTEGLLLSLLGGAAGLLLAFWATDILVSSAIPKLPFMTIDFPSTPDWRVLGATLGFCLLSTFLFGFLPAWKLSQTDVNRELKEHGGELGAAGGRSLFAPRNLVVIGQIALSLALLAAAGLFTRGAIKAAKVDPGFTMESGLLAEVDAALGGYDETRGRQLYQELLERLRALPGVRSAAMASVVPFGLFSEGTAVRKASAPASTDSDTETKGEKPVDIGAGLNIVTTDYFKTLGLPLLRGREFERLEVESSTAAPVVIIDQALAEKLWPGEDPLGRFVQLESNHEGAQKAPAQIVGVVATVRNDLTEKALQPHVYVPFGQKFRSQMNLHVKTTFETPAAEAAFLKTLREQIRSVDDGLPVISMQTLRDFRDGGLLLWFVKTGARLFGIFGGLALFLAVVGVYGVKSYVVAQRTREIGIRMAMGATKSGVVWMIVREGGMLTAAGLAAGFLLALGVGRLLSSVLYDVHGADPLVFSITPLVLAAAAVLACYVPARRAARIQPMDALRHE